MKKEMILPVSPVQSGTYDVARSSVVAAFKSFCLNNACTLSLAAFYTRLLGLRVNPLQTLRLLHAQFAFVLMVFPLAFPPFVRFLLLCWFALTVWQCRRSGLR